MAAEGTSQHLAMSQHPDIMALRERYDLVAETPRAWTVEGLIVLAGAYAAVSPWIIGFAGRAGALAVNDLIIGLMVALLGAGMAVSYARSHGMTWVLPVMGIWLIIAPWVVQDITTTAGTIVSNVIIGVLVLVFGVGLWAMGMSGRTTTT
jgi:hypothetical protein